MKKQLVIFFVLLLTTLFNVNALDKYITDDAKIYLRRGPGAQYALSGSVQSGEKITVLEVSSNGKYTKIKDGNGRVAWIETAELSDEPSAKARLPILEKQLAEYQSKENNLDTHQQSMVDEYADKLRIAEESVANLTKQNDALQKMLKEQNNKIQSMSVVVDVEKRSFMFKWFLYGGLIGLGGVLLGFILPSMAPSRRKQRWMI